MIIGNSVFLSPVLYAIEKLIEDLEIKDELTRDESLIYNALQRDKALFEKLNIHCIEFGNKTFDDYIVSLDKKRNILFLTDEEVQTYAKALKLYNNINSIMKDNEKDDWKWNIGFYKWF